MESTGKRAFVVAVFAVALSASWSMSVAAAQTSPLPDYELAKRFQPYLMFDRKERWRPIDPSVLLAEGNHEACSQAGECRAIESALTLQGADLNRRGSFIALNGTRGVRHPDRFRAPDLGCNDDVREPLRRALLDCDHGRGARIFFHVFHLPEGVYVEYWFYYRFDLTDAQVLMGHQSDWEGIVVAPQPPAYSTFAWVGFAAHKGAPWRYARDVMRCDSERPGSCGSEAGAHVGQRVLVYVAEGSHASYPRPCHRTSVLSCGQNAKFKGLFALPERGFDGGAPWAANNDPTTLAAIDVQPWLGWKGSWNARGKLDSSVVDSPPNQGRYDKPAVTQPARCEQRWCQPVL